MRPRVSMRQALEDDQLLGHVLPGTTWALWRSLLIACMGEELTDRERRMFEKLTGRSREPGQRCEEAWLVVGRRGGKSRAEAALAAYVAGCCEHPALVPGEQGIVLCIAPDQKQANVVLGYARAAFEVSPILRHLVAGNPADAINLVDDISIEVRASNFRKLRGPSYLAILADESAFWFDSESGSSNPDSEILNSCRPGLATTGGMLIVASSPYARRGELWEAFKDNYGKKGDPLVLVAKGSSRDLNPTLSKKVVERAYAKDAASASAEYGGEFRSDIAAFIDRDSVEAVVVRGVRERPPIDGIKYFGFCDPSGGSSDSFTLAIGHREDGKVLVDCIRETKPPFSPSGVIDEYCQDLKRYRVHEIEGDRYAGEFAREPFRARGIQYRVASKPKSDLYLDLLPSINSAQVDLLDSKTLVSQLCALERRTARSGRDSIDHPPRGHDDLANAVAGVVHVVMQDAARSGDFTPGPLPSAQIIGPGYAPAAPSDFSKPPWEQWEEDDDDEVSDEVKEKENA